MSNFTVAFEADDDTLLQRYMQEYGAIKKPEANTPRPDSPKVVTFHPL